MVTMVLLNEAWMCAMPSATFFLTFLRARAAAVCCSSWRVGAFLLAMCLCGLPCWDVEFDGRLARTFARARVGARTLPAYWQALAMARAAIAAEIDQALDRHLHFAAQVAFDGELGDALADAIELAVVQILDLAVRLHAGRSENRLGASAADAIDRGQRDRRVLVI